MTYVIDEETEGYFYIFPGYLRSWPCKELKDIYGGAFSEQILLMKENKLTFLFKKGELENLGKIIFDRLNDKQFLGQLKKKFDRVNEQHEALLLSDVKHLTDKELIQRLKKIYELYSQLILHSMLVEPFNRYADTVIEKERKNIKEKDMAVLLTPKFRSFVDRSNSSIREISRSKNKDELIDEHIKKFIWMRSGHFSCIPLTKEDVLEEIKDIDEMPHEKISKEKILSKYSFSQDFLTLIENLDDIAEIHDKRKEFFLKNVYYSNHIYLKEFSSRLDKEIDFFRWIDPFEDFEKAFYDLASLEPIVDKRKQAVAWVSDLDGVKEYNGKEAEKIFNKVYTNLEKEASEVLQGMSAGISLGNIQGKIYIIKSKKDFENFPKDGILVTTMTKTDSLPFMKRAKAIVTDDGGVTCHAAIVSRELGKPCIIGTKHATKVLKDGDLVEIDTVKGIVRKI